MTMMQEEALKYSNAGIKIVQLYTIRDGICSCGGKAPFCRPTSAGKHPMGREGVYGNSKDPEVIQKWWEAEPDANIGIPTGAQNDGLYCQDVDNPEIAKKLIEFFTSPDAPPGFAVAQTGREGGGCHIYFRALIDKQTENFYTTDGEKIGELRGSGAYVVAPPSLHYSGQRYKWIVGSLTETELATFPDPRTTMLGIFQQNGITVSASKKKLSKEELGDIPPVEPIDCPFDRSGNMILEQMLTGTYLQSDRSKVLWLLGKELWAQAKKVGYDATLTEIAGVIKQADTSWWQKFAGRKDQDFYYWQKAAESKESFERGGSARSTAGDGDPFYAYDDARGSLFYNNGKRDFKIANFKPQVIEEQIVINNEGKRIESAYKVLCQRPDEEVTITLTTKSVQSAHTMQKDLAGQLPRQYIVRDKQWYNIWEAANELSDEVKVTKTYATTGWIETEFGWAFILPGSEGGISAEGVDPRITHYGFAGKVPERYNLYGANVRPIDTNDEYDLAVSALTHLLDCLPAGVLVPILDLILGAPLSSLGLRTAPPLVHIFGQTGQLKTSSILAIMSILGKFTGLRDIPESWSSTVASLQQGLHILRDLPLLIDDYKTLHMRSSDAARLVQNYADGVARSRMGSDQERRESLVPYAFLISTGEERWENEQSVQARVISLQFPRLELGSEEFKERSRAIRTIQDHAEAGELALIGGTYLRYIAELLSTYGAERLAKQIAKWRDKELKAIDLPVHARVLDTLAGMRVIERFTGSFLKNKFSATPGLYDKWTQLRDENEAYQKEWILQEAAEAGDLSPVRQVLAAIREGLVNETVKIVERKTGQGHGDTLAPNMVALFDDQGVYLNERITFSWYQAWQRRGGNDIPFSWRAVKRDAIESMGAEERQLKEEGSIKTICIPHDQANLVIAYTKGDSESESGADR